MTSKLPAAALIALTWCCTSTSAQGLTFAASPTGRKITKQHIGRLAGTLTLWTVSVRNNGSTERAINEAALSLELVSRGVRHTPCPVVQTAWEESRRTGWSQRFARILVGTAAVTSFSTQAGWPKTTSSQATVIGVAALAVPVIVQLLRNVPPDGNKFSQHCFWKPLGLTPGATESTIVYAVRADGETDIWGELPYVLPVSQSYDLR